MSAKDRETRANSLPLPVVFFTALVILAHPFFAGTSAAWEGRFPTYEAYMVYTHNDPYALESDWSDNFQGITHDAENWYLTQEKVLFRVPLSVDLNQNLKDIPEVHHVYVPNIPPLWGETNRYDHFGDASFYDPNPTDANPGYVIVAMTGHIYDTFDGVEYQVGDLCAGLAVFRANETLDFVDFACWPEAPPDVSESQGTQGGWAAVSPEGLIYSSRNHASIVYIYNLDWARLDSTGNLVLTSMDAMPLFHLANRVNVLYQLDSMQGGVISDSGKVLYLSAGLDCDSDVRGLFAFEIPSGQLIASSCQDGCFFKFQWDCGTLDDEPEGLTIWDLDGKDAPGTGMSGQLHVGMVDNDADTDQVYIKHYTMRRYLRPGDGIQAEYDAVFDHAELNFAPGTYPEAITLGADGKRVRLVAPEGPVIIGGP